MSEPINKIFSDYDERMKVHYAEFDAAVKRDIQEMKRRLNRFILGCLSVAAVAILLLKLLA